MSIDSAILALIDAENTQNNTLAEMLGLIKPTRGTQTSLNAIVRGLVTRNRTLIKLSTQCHANLARDPKDAFKSFVNDFILWLDDGYVIFEKYFALFPLDYDYGIFGRPIMHLTRYVDFIDAATALLRNPFVIDKLKLYGDKLNGLVTSFESHQEDTLLNEISFDDIVPFGDMLNSRVSSFFRIDQIVDRTRNQPLHLGDGTAVELVLLNFNSSTYDALAILSVKPHGRLLLYPPFRINEVLIKWDGSLVLSALSFSAKVKATTNQIVVSGSQHLLEYWVDLLGRIFPNSAAPINKLALIELEHPFKLSGLGINVYTSPTSVATPKNITAKPSFKDLITSPSLSVLPLNQLSQRTTHPDRISDTALEDLAPPYIRKKSFGSVLSVDSGDSRSQYERSLDIIHKTLSTPDQNSCLKCIPQNLVLECEHDRPKSSLAPIQYASDDESVVDAGPQLANQSLLDLSENYQNKQQNAFASVPDLSQPKVFQNPAGTGSAVEVLHSLYKLANGSAVDIDNFGKDHQPSFSVHHDLASLQPVQSKRMSIFSIFRKKKPAKKLALRQEAKKEAAIKKETDNKTEEAHTSAEQTPEETDTEQITEETSTEQTTKEISTDQNEASINSPSNSDIPATIAKKVLTINTNISNLSEEVATGKMVTASTSLPSPFALPSSTSTYFFKPHAKPTTPTEKDDEVLYIPQTLKDTINSEQLIDFYISPSAPKAMKVSRWKQKYGKWEMVTVSESIFIKIVANYDLNKSWMIVFKEEYDHHYNEVIDKPILLLDIGTTSSIRQLSALDLQITTLDSISLQKILVMVRCTSGSLSTAILSHFNNILGVLRQSRASNDSNVTLLSSLMEPPSHSTTMTSIESPNDHTIKQHHPRAEPILGKEISFASLNSEDITNANIISNPDNTKVLLLNHMTIRLQHHLDPRDLVHLPSSWKILAMYSLSIYMISDAFTSRNFYNMILENKDSANTDESIETFNWLIPEDAKLDRIERIGKAGLLIKAAPDTIYMVECKGKKEFKQLFELF